MAGSSWQMEDVFARVKRASYAGLEMHQLQQEILRHLRSEIHFEAFCFNRIDPATELIVGTKGEGVGGSAELRFFLEQIYFDDDLLDFKQLARSRRPVGVLSRATGGKLERALRYRTLFQALGLGDELRGVFTAGRRTWGSVTLFRGKGDPFYGEAEAKLMARIAPHVGAGMRAALALDRASNDVSSHRAPGMLLLGPSGGVEYLTPAAERWLEEIEDFLGQWTIKGQLPVAVMALAASLKRALAMQTETDQDLVPQITTRGRGGEWVTLHVATANAPSGGEERTTVVLAPAQAVEIAQMQTSAYALTAAEESVCRMVVAGKTTQEIAACLHISPYTVQDHLKGIFDKVGVRSRRELVKHLYLCSPSLPLGDH